MTDPPRAAEYAADVREFLQASANPMRAIAMVRLGLYEAASGRLDVGYQLCASGACVAGEAGLDWAESMAAGAQARLAMEHATGDPAADVSAAFRLHRQKRAWYALWFLVSEMMPWLRSSGRDDLADTIENYLASNDIRAGSTTVASTTMTRDDLIDRVLEELEETDDSSGR